MHGPGDGYVEEAAVQIRVVVLGCHVGDDDLVKFQAFGHVGVGDHDAVFVRGALIRQEYDPGMLLFQFFVQGAGVRLVFADDPQGAEARVLKPGDQLPDPLHFFFGGLVVQ